MSMLDRMITRTVVVVMFSLAAIIFSAIAAVIWSPAYVLLSLSVAVCFGAIATWLVLAGVHTWRNT
jgi:hypothetical protein